MVAWSPCKFCFCVTKGALHINLFVHPTSLHLLFGICKIKFSFPFIEKNNQKNQTNPNQANHTFVSIITMIH